MGQLWLIRDTQLLSSGGGASNDYCNTRRHQLQLAVYARNLFTSPTYSLCGRYHCTVGQWGSPLRETKLSWLLRETVWDRTFRYWSMPHACGLMLAQHWLEPKRLNPTTCFF
eukprot:COSAG02_NODE_2030_length_10067_cov_22.885333_3_plen_112_part_00